MGTRRRPGPSRTRRTNGQEPLRLSSLPPEDFNVRPGETRSIVCPGCRCWRRITGETTLKIREHCVSDWVPRGSKHTLCAGSLQVVIVDIDVRRWQAQQDRLLRDAMPQETRRADREFHKPIPDPTPPTFRIRAEITLESARQAYLRHRRNPQRAGLGSADDRRPGCVACTGRQHCLDGARLARQYVLALYREPGRREERQQQAQQEAREARLQAALWPRKRGQQWARRLPVVQAADARRAQIPAGDTPMASPPVPLTTLHPVR